MTDLLPSIPEIEERKQHAHTVFSKADAALREGKINAAEHNALLLATFGTTSEQSYITYLDSQRQAFATPSQSSFRTPFVIGAFFIVMLSLFGALFYSSGGITGAVVYQQNTIYTSNAQIPIELIDISRLNISGIAQGDGTIIIALTLNNNTYSLYNYEHGPIITAHASLPKSRYDPGEPVIYTASNVSSAYLMTATDAVLLNATQLDNLAPGAYTLKLLIDDGGLSQETLDFVVSSQLTQAESFNSCGELCHTSLSGSAIIEVVVMGNASVQIDTITTSAQANSAPLLRAAIPDTTGETVAIDLSLYYMDPDGDTMTYTSSSHPKLQEAIDGSTLTVSGLPGTYTYLAYATDGEELTPSNIFTITIPAPVNTSEQNDTASINETLVNPLPTNVSNNTVVQTVAPVVPIDECAIADPNLRPLSCIQGEDSSYFKPEDIIIENKNAVAVGQLTPIGNLLIKGQIVEQSSGSPSTSDYAFGYQDGNGDYIPTVWIDSTTGDLHMRGTLTEANGNIPMQDGYSALANKRGIVLALVDRYNGDVIVRGNVIPYRRSFS